MHVTKFTSLDPSENSGASTIAMHSRSSASTALSATKPSTRTRSPSRSVRDSAHYQRRRRRAERRNFTSSSCAPISRDISTSIQKSDVRPDEAASHSISERGADDDVDVVDGLGREFTAGAAATGDEVVVQAIDVFDA